MDFVSTNPNLLQWNETCCLASCTKTSVVADEFQPVVDAAGISGNTWDELIKNLENRIEPQQLREEWSTLQEKSRNKPPEMFSEATQSHNMSKNRYPDVLPMDCTRVTLSQTEGIEGSSYINANFVRAGEHNFIACQAPLVTTFDDFYRMLWEYDVPVIVMLTKLIEDDKVKADNYLPFDSKLYGDIIVEVTECKKACNEKPFTCKKIKMTKDGEVKELVHYNYLDWPDHGTPDLESVLQLMKVVLNAQQESAGPQVVHCSAGIGRTGTWIALTVLLEEMRKAAEKNTVPQLNVMKTIYDLRSQRSGSLTSILQYEFIYDALLSYAKLLQKEQTPSQHFLRRSR